MVTVTVPPAGIVTEPSTVVPLMLKPAVVAPPDTALPRLTALPNWPGKVSTNWALVSVLGPAFVITKLKVVVAPSATVVVFASLVTPRLTAGATLKVALPTFEFAPTVVVKDPTGIELVIVPVSVLVTTEVTVQEAFGGMTVPTGKVSVPSPELTEGTPPAQLVAATELKLTSPAGY